MRPNESVEKPFKKTGPPRRVGYRLAFAVVVSMTGAAQRLQHGCLPGRAEARVDPRRDRDEVGMVNTPF